MAFKKPEILVLLAVAACIPALHAQDSGSSCRKSGPQPGFAEDCPIVQVAWSIPEQDQAQLANRTLLLRLLQLRG